MKGKVVQSGMFLRTHVGNGTGEIDGKEIKYELALSIKSEPLVIFEGNRTYTLSWQDILELAEDAGLFTTAPETAKGGADV